MNMFENFKKILILSAMGLGLGFGVTVSVLWSQSTVQATPQRQKAIYTVRPVKVTIGENLSYTVGDQDKPSVLRVTGNSELGSGTTLLLRGTGNTLFTELSTLTLGASITALGSNNGIYSYSVTEVITIERGHAETLRSDTTENLIITAHQFPWDTTEIAVIASYRQK